MEKNIVVKIAVNKCKFTEIVMTYMYVLFFIHTFPAVVVRWQQNKNDKEERDDIEDKSDRVHLGR